MNHYQVLGVPMGADPAEIRRAYLRLARRHHPDNHTGEGTAALEAAQRRMQEVNGAWAVLGDPGRRRRYDDVVRQGRADPQPGPTSAGRDGVSSPGWRPRADDTAWMDDFATWRDETDDLVPPDPPRSPVRRAVTVLPVAVFLGAVALGCVALVLQARPLLGLAFVGVGLSAAMFFVLPMLEMARRRDR